MVDIDELRARSHAASALVQTLSAEATTQGNLFSERCSSTGKAVGRMQR